MRYTYTEALQEMVALVEKMKIVFPEDAYKIQCTWESVQEGWGSQVSEDEVYDDGFEDGKQTGYDVGYDRGYDEGYADCESEYRRFE